MYTQLEIGCGKGGFTLGVRQKKIKILKKKSEFENGRLTIFPRRFSETCGQFHQHFTSSFGANILAPKKYKPKP